MSIFYMVTMATVHAVSLNGLPVKTPLLLIEREPESRSESMVLTVAVKLTSCMKSGYIVSAFLLE